MSYERREAESLSWTTTTYEVGKNYRGVLADMTCGLPRERASRSDQRTYDDLLAACRHHRRQPVHPPALDSSREGFGPLRVGLGPMPGWRVTMYISGKNNLCTFVG